MARILGSIVVCLWLLWAAEAWTQAPDTLYDFLQQQMGLSAADFSALRQGRVVGTVPTALNPREIAAFGVVRVNAPIRTLAGALVDIETYMRGEAVLESGRFSNPPALADLKGLTVQDADLDALRVCRVGNCGLKLSAAMIERLHREVPWSAADWRAQATARLKQMLVDYVTVYLHDGTAALAEYVDKALAVKLADETRSLVSASPYLKDHAPEFLGHLGRPATTAPLAGTTRVIYWAKEQFGFKPTITISDVTTYQPGAGPAGTILVATTQLYATHYFEASVALTVATTTGGPPAQPGFDLLYMHRSRIDSLRGGFVGLKRFTAGRRLRNRLEAILQQHKTHVEKQATGAGH